MHDQFQPANYLKILVNYILAAPQIVTKSYLNIMFKHCLIRYVFIISGLLLSHISAGKEIPLSAATQAAQNFFRLTSGNSNATAEIRHTFRNTNNRPLMYVFGFKGTKGFVILSSDDAASPLIAYSLDEDFTLPGKGSNLEFYFAKRKMEIDHLQHNKIEGSASELREWSEMITGDLRHKKSQAAVAPLISTKWNQFSFYNDSCPSESAAGCVATAMAQIMKYWAYPLTGTGTHSYCCCKNNGFLNDYGVLKANFGASTYNWAAMPYMVNSSSPEVAQLMYHCGVAVEMDYDPAGSSAGVIANNAYSAEKAFKDFFKYNPNTLTGVYRNQYDEPTWISMVKNDLDLGRPVQYLGFGTEGGHTWVCDGYDNNDLFHMNWGWGGNSDGYYNINNLNSQAGDFSVYQGALFGIVPVFSDQNDAGIISLSYRTNACSGNTYTPKIKVRNYSNAPLTSFVVNYNMDAVAGTFTWNGNLLAGESTELILNTYTLIPGEHLFSASISDPNNAADQNPGNNSVQYKLLIVRNGTPPLFDGFESVQVTDSLWVKQIPLYGNAWTLTNKVKATGENSLMVDQLTNTSGNKSMLTSLLNLNTMNMAEPMISFKHAYQRKTSNSNDELRLELSFNCGNTWQTQWSSKGNALATTTISGSNPYLPASNEFRQNKIAIQNSTNMLIRLVFVSDALSPGNNIYLDDIHLFDASLVGLSENQNNSLSGVALYPNPNNGHFFLRSYSSGDSQWTIRINDVTGRLVHEQHETMHGEGEKNVWIHSEHLDRGIFFVTVSDGSAHKTFKMAVNK